MNYFILGALVLGFVSGWGCEAYRWHAHELKIENSSLKNAVKTDERNEKEVIKYVDRVVEIKSAPRVVVRERLVNRVCPASNPGMPDKPDSDEAVATDAADRLAGELPDCAANRAQLDAIQAEIAPQLPKGQK